MYSPTRGAIFHWRNKTSTVCVFKHNEYIFRAYQLGTVHMTQRFNVGNPGNRDGLNPMPTMKLGNFPKQNAKVKTPRSKQPTTARWD